MVEIRKLTPTVKISYSKLAIPQRPEKQKPIQRPRVIVVERRLRDHLPPTPQPTPCRIWQGAVDRDGYGQITKTMVYKDGRTKPRRVGMHRHIMELMEGRTLRKSEVVLHACDNPICYRYDHLSIGTTQDNTADMVAKGRNSKPPVNIFHGEAHPMAKISANTAAYALRLYQSGMTQKHVAEKIGLSKSQTQRILRGQSWKPPAPSLVPLEKPKWSPKQLDPAARRSRTQPNSKRSKLARKGTYSRPLPEYR